MSTVSFLHRFLCTLIFLDFFFVVSPCIVVAVQPWMEWIPIFFKKSTIYRSIYTIQLLLYGCCRIIQIAAGKINKNAKDLYLVKAPKNSKTKKKVFVKTKAINFKMYYIRNPVDTKKWTSNPSINLKFLRRRQNLVKKAWVPKDLIN